MTNRDAVQTSKFLALLLRHKPETIGLQLDEAGWTDVDTLLQRMNEHGHPITLDDLKLVVDTNNKRRFAFDETGTRIRASQGHSYPVQLGYPPSVPPDVLYHGTSENRLPVILKHGLEKRQRHHVHLYANIAWARRVGQRHGTPRVLQINARQMHQDGKLFFVSANGVWLTDHVEPGYIVLLEDAAENG